MFIYIYYYYISKGRDINIYKFSYLTDKIDYIS